MGNVGIMPREVMPRNLIVSFKNDKILFDISAPFGNSGILNLSNPEEDIYDNIYQPADMEILLFLNAWRITSGI